MGYDARSILVGTDHVSGFGRFDDVSGDISVPVETAATEGANPGSSGEERAICRGSGEVEKMLEVVSSFQASRRVKSVWRSGMLQGRCDRRRFLPLHPTLTYLGAIFLVRLLK